MANLLATAATHGGVISRAISNGKRFIGGRSISSTSSSHVILDKLSATKILQCAFAGKIQPPPRPERVDADADELCMTPDCDYYGHACQKLGEDGEYHCLNCWSTNGDLNVPHVDMMDYSIPPPDWSEESSASISLRLNHFKGLVRDADSKITYVPWDENIHFYEGRRRVSAFINSICILQPRFQ